MKTYLYFLAVCNFSALFCLAPLEAKECLSSKAAETCENDKNEKDDNKEKDDDNDKDKDDKKIEPLKIGNFKLPQSQQPAALFGFGGNIIEKGEVQLFFFADYFRGSKKIVTDLIPSVLFGITEDLSIYFVLPVAPRLRDGKDTSKGFEDTFVQFEYAFYNKSSFISTDQATFVFNISAPTGSATKNPPTGFGSPGFFLGGTYYHMTFDWFVFTAAAAVLTCKSNRTKIGDQFLYQFGFGRNIPSPEGRIYAWMIEVDGQYNKKNRIKGKLDKNSGGNAIYLTPSIWLSTKRWLFQFGGSIPLNQNLFGKQGKIDYALNLNVGWSFY